MTRLLFLWLLLASTPMAWSQSQQIPANFQKVLDTHGFKKWQQIQGLSFAKGEGEYTEYHLVSLADRKIRVEGSGYTIGYDGSDVWISPADAAFGGSPRFYHNLFFYFFAMPFVLGDPGITYTEVPNATLQGNSYAGVKISFGSDVGNSPDDNYIVYYDPQTYKMAWLMYTSTYHSGQASSKYNLIKYESWMEAPGMLFPQVISWYNYQNGTVGEEQSSITFPSVDVSMQAPLDSRFARPEDSRIAEK